MLGGADNPNGELPSYITGADTTKVITEHVPLPMADKVEQMVVRLERSRGWIIKQALSDLARLCDFMVLASKPAAAGTVQSLT